MAFFRKSKGKVGKAVVKPTAPARTGKKRGNFPTVVKLLAVDALEAGLSQGEVAEIVGAGASTVAKWRKLYLEGGEKALMRKASNPGSRRICGELERRIERMRRDHPEAGVRRIRDELKREQGVGVSAETVRRVVNDAGIGAPPVQKKRRPPQVRRFEKSVPNWMWQIDIFTFSLKRMYPVYLVGMIDDHSRYIVGHGLFRQQTAQSVLEVVKGAIGQWGAPREILSDNGRQFAAWRGETKFQKTLKRQGVRHVRSAPQHPMTLGKIERFWKTIWDEFLDDAYFASFADACQRLDHWIGYYNHQRPHQGIDGLCPADRFYGVADDVDEALRQGCKENALQLALGQETRPPLFLLGKVGETDVRVIRKGENVEVKLGDAVHETIRVGSPFKIDEQGRILREDSNDEMEGFERGGALPGGSTGAQQRGHDHRALQELWGESADLEQGDREGGLGGDGGAGAQESGSPGQVGGAVGGRGFEKGEGVDGAGAWPLEAEIRDRDDLRGLAPQGVERGGAAGGGSGGSAEADGKKKEAPVAKAKDFDEIWSESDLSEDGDEP